jgi:hypothetical protein
VPFKRIRGSDKYRSPRGNVFTKKQVALYYANDGFPSGKKGFLKAKAKRKRSGTVRPT